MLVLVLSVVYNLQITERIRMLQKTSIRFFDTTPVRAVWSADEFTWFYSAVDVISAVVKSKNPRV